MAARWLDLEQQVYVTGGSAPNVELGVGGDGDAARKNEVLG